MKLIPSDFTDDEYERSLLIHEDGPPDPNDAYHVEMHDIAVLLANFRDQLTPIQRRAIPFIHQGLNNTEVAQKADCSPQTVAKALKDPNVRQCLRLLMQADRLQAGPSSEQRVNMLWRIANRTEKKQPTTAIRALDVINKQMGAYAPEESTPRAPVINIKNFIMEQKERPRDIPSRPANKPEEEAEDAVFTPISLTAEDDNSLDR